MVQVKFTYALKRFYPNLKTEDIHAGSIADLVAKLDEIYPRISSYLLEENGALRKHVNIFVGSTIIKDKSSLSDTLVEGDKVYIMQALSGG